MTRKWKWLLLVSIGLIIMSGMVFLTLTKSDSRQTTESVVEKVNDLNELATAEAYTKVIIEKENNKIFGQEIDLDLPGTKQKLLVIIPGTVRSGVDLSKVATTDVKVDEQHKKIQLVLPQPEIFGEPALDLDKVKIFSSEGLFRDEAKIKEGFSLAKEAQQQMIEEAKGQGLLERAKMNAEKAISDVFKLVDYEVTIEFNEGE